MAKLGAHIVSGSRNGYGDFCAGKPAVALSVDDGGALSEAKQKSGGYTLTIFRQTDVYLEAPPDFNTHPNMVALAQYWYPQLKAKWLQNPGNDYYTVTNEIGGNDEAVLVRLVTYEREIMRLANLDGLKVCVLNLAGGSPGDIEVWKRVCLPFVLEAWAGRNIYGRHAYGGGDLVNPDGSVIAGNPSRPFSELGYLRQAGAAGGIAITETGIDGGFGFSGIERFTKQLQGYEKLLRPYPEFIGACGWTLGNWSEASWQTALPAMAQYLIDNPTPKWEWPTPIIPPPDPTPIPPPVNYVAVANLLPQNVTAAEVQHVLTQTFAQRESVVYSADDAARLVAPAKPGSKVKVWSPGRWQNDIVAWLQAKGVQTVELHYLPGDEPGPEPPPAEFKAAVWPTVTKHVTQEFGDNPEDYAQFNLPGHEGIDLVAPIGTPYFAIAAGVVVKVSDKRSDGTPSAYGWHVIVDHENGYTSLYAHAVPNPPVTVGQRLGAGHILAFSGNSGHSSGHHLHLTIKKDGYTAPGWGCCPGYIDPWPFLEDVYNQIDPPRPPLVTGYGYSQYLDEVGDFLKATANLNIRETPAGDGQLIGVLRVGSIARPTGTIQNGYRPVEVSIHDLSGYNPTPPAVASFFGLHAGADGGVLSGQEIAEFGAARAEVVKVLSSTAPESVTALAALLPASKWIVRAFLDFRTEQGPPRNISPQQFYQDTIEDVKRTVQAIGSGREVWVELHNEPNLVQEGMTGAWDNGAEFNGWLTNILSLYRANLPGVKFLFPGLSPGEHIPGVRQDHWTFLAACQAVIALCDGLAVHIYWAADYPMSTALGVLDGYLSRVQGRPVWITEASRNDRVNPPPASVYAADYILFWRESGRKQRIRGVTYFVASASDPTFAAEAWIAASGQSKGIGATVGLR